jgi:hypothetical protein
MKAPPQRPRALFAELRREAMRRVAPDGRLTKLMKLDTDPFTKIYPNLLGMTSRMRFNFSEKP